MPDMPERCDCACHMPPVAAEPVVLIDENGPYLCCDCWPSIPEDEKCQLCDKPATHEVVHGGTVEMPHIGYYCLEHSDDYA